jgi:hypothetical protein
MSSKSDICNLALSNIGISQWVANIETDRSNEAIVCNRWYDITVDFTLRDYDWNFARRRLALAALTTALPSEWDYVYAYPTDCLIIRRIQREGFRKDTIASRIPYEVGGETGMNADTRVIYTDEINAVVVYTKKITDPSLFDPHFVLALGYALAANIALPLAVKPGYVDQMRNAYLQMVSNAAARNFEEAEEGPEPPSETEMARNL